MTEKKTFIQRHGTNIALFLLIILFFGAVFFHRIFIFINAGEAGVMFRRFFGGVVTTKVYPEGLRIILPWDSMTIYDVRVQKIQVEYKVLSSNGLPLKLVASARFHPYYNALPLLHQRIGPNYVEKVVIPIVESSIRRIVGQHRAEDLYTNKGPVIYEINEHTASDLGENFIALDGVVIQSIQLPQFIQQAVELKEEQRELLEAYGYRLRREKDEALRKEIEAFGWQNFNTVVGQSLTPRLLQWRAIEATRELASSRNTKVVIMGNGDKGLPVLLGADYNGAGPVPDLTKGQPGPGDVVPMDRLEARLKDTVHRFDNLLQLNNPERRAPPPTPTAPTTPSPSPVPVQTPTPGGP